MASGFPVTIIFSMIYVSVYDNCNKYVNQDRIPES